MTAFENLKSQWGNQGQIEIPQDGAKQILNKITRVQKKQRITNFVLVVTGLILVGFFFYVSAYKFQTVMIGLLLMIGVLLVRIGIECLSIRSLKNINVSTTVEKFKKQIFSYSKRRTIVHFIGTPILIFVYCVGFIMLLPAFKENLSSGFYSYVVISSIVILVILSLFIAREVMRELTTLKELKD